MGINIAHMFRHASISYIIEKLTVATEAFSFIYLTIGFIGFPIQDYLCTMFTGTGYKTKYI